MELQTYLQSKVQQAIQSIYDVELEKVDFQATKKDFKGDITIVVFPILRQVKGNPEVIGKAIGGYLKENSQIVKDYNTVKGFLNLEIEDSYYTNNFASIYKEENYGFKKPDADKKGVMIEYSSPNTNKPLHLGHIRNNLLGYSVANIIEAAGNKVYKTQIINDRGIHICKSMIAWEKFGNGETPESTGLKGDKLVGNYYVKFDSEYKKQIKALMDSGSSEDEAKKNAPLIKEAQEMLLKWEKGDSEVIELWKTMNQWVYDGFKQTYANLGVSFDSIYYESNTYLLGKDIVNKGLKDGVFFAKEDGSVWIDLTDEGLDEKIVLRSDGTSVYMTQDIGTAIERFNEYKIDKLTYTVGNEQDYHFKVLFLILSKLGYSWAENLHHLSYGMVDLPSGKMKSREGTVVDADDLMVEMTNSAREISQELGKLEGYDNDEKESLYTTIGMGALKYYILKVDPKKRILFDPKESIDFNGNTGPFIQYTHARIKSILRKAPKYDGIELNNDIEINEKEKSLIKQLALYPETIQSASNNQSPALVANYIYDLVKAYNSFYQSSPILVCEDDNLKTLRLQLSSKVSDIIKQSLRLLGINSPERM
ncbi:MAG: arginine--tRNA ligase [Flavobacteriaceae bacterium]|nr:arginine--tRNA ligase [Flavobacteriaceae bacterium]